MPQQKRGLFGASQDSVRAFADDSEAARRWNQRPQAIGGLLHFERRELARLGLQPKLRAGDLVDETRIAGIGLVAEIDLAEASAFRRGQNAHEQEMRLSRSGACENYQQGRQPRMEPSHG